jgi:hypothetical protein
MLHSFAAEPATVLYLLTGAATFGWARITRSRRARRQASTMMLISQRRSRMAMDSLDLLERGATKP